MSELGKPAGESTSAFTAIDRLERQNRYLRRLTAISLAVAVLSILGFVETHWANRNMQSEFAGARVSARLSMLEQQLLFQGPHPLLGTSLVIVNSEGKVICEIGSTEVPQTLPARVESS